MPHFMQDVEQIRERARRKIEDGAVTDAYKGDVQHAISLLNEALATEIVCVLRYMHHYFMATGVHGKSVADEFKEHADAEREHADELAERIQQLGGKPDFDPGSLVQRSASQYIEGETLSEMIREDLIAERVVIEVYSDMIRYFGDNDPTTRVLLEHIMAEEEEHASDLSDLLFIVDPHTGESQGEDPGTHPLDMHSGQGKQAGQSGGSGGSGRRDRREQHGQAAKGQRANNGERGRTKAQPGGSGESNRVIETPRGPQSPQPAARRQPREEQGGQGRPGMPMTASEARPANTPGGAGRTARIHPQQRADAETSGRADEGAQGGATRAVRVTKPNRKNRVA
jgi:bacterioferritin